MKDLDGQTILVTGASKGIGKAIAELLLSRGAQVGVHYHSGKEEAKSFKLNFDEARTFKADLSDQQQVYPFFEEAVKTMGSIDTVILNAGIFKPHSTSLESDDWFNIWRETMKVNLDAAGLITKLGIDHFKLVGKGRFIYIGSRAAFRGETEEYLAYAASKGGLTSLARSVARSFGKINITSFVVAPGFTRTAMAEQFIAQHGEQKVLGEIALNELTKPEDIAPLVALICSGKMDHATGTTIDINAGSHIR